MMIRDSQAISWANLAMALPQNPTDTPKLRPEDLLRYSTRMTSTYNIKPQSDHDFVLSSSIIHDYEPEYKVRSVDPLNAFPLVTYICETATDNDILEQDDYQHFGIDDILSLAKFKEKAPSVNCCANCSQPLEAALFGWNYFCQYTGLHYCKACISPQKSMIPSRIVADWDFKPRNVSLHSYQKIEENKKTPFIHLRNTQPSFFTKYPKLCVLEELRGKLTQLVVFIRTCKVARAKFLADLGDRVHLINSIHFYSIQDLIDIYNDKLEPFLRNYYKDCTSHITQDCESCQGKGNYCEICKSDSIIFSFQSATTTSCVTCGSLFHLDCARKAKLGEGLVAGGSGTPGCPKCARTARIHAKHITGKNPAG